TDIAENFTPIDEIKKFCGHSKVIVAGSTWPSDEKIIKEATSDLPDLKMIIAPHEIHEEHLKQLKTIFPDSTFYSQLSDGVLSDTTHLPIAIGTHSNILIIDNIGLLSK